MLEKLGSRLVLMEFLLLTQVAFSRAAPPSPETDLVIVFDTSGSMEETVGGGVNPYASGSKKLDIAKSAMWTFVDMLPRNINVGLVTFSNEMNCESTTVQEIRRSTPQTREQLKAAISHLRANGNTPIGAALQRATALLADSKRKKRIVVMTDGEETCDEAGLASIADEAWKQDIKVYAIGFAFGQGSRNFRKVGVYKAADDEKQLASVFVDIKKSLEKETGRYDESKRDPALAETPSPSYQGRAGHFRSAGGDRAGKLFKTLQLNSSYEHRFNEQDRFTVLEHGYHIVFNEQEYLVDKVEVLRVRLEEKLSFIYGGVEGFAFVNDVVME